MVTLAHNQKGQGIGFKPRRHGSWWIVKIATYKTTDASLVVVRKNFEKKHVIWATLVERDSLVEIERANNNLA